MDKYRSTGGVVAVMASGTQRASLNAFVASLPEWLPLPVVISITDVEEDGESLLARLRHGCVLPIHDVKDPCQVYAGHVYLSAVGESLCLREGRVFVPPVRSTGSPLLSSAVATIGAGTVAILLAGAIESSADAARKVVWAGGTVFAHQVHEEPPALVRNGIARAYKHPEYLGEALALVCSGVQTRHAG